MHPQLSVPQTHRLLHLRMYIALQIALPRRPNRPTIHRPRRPRTIQRNIHPILAIKPHIHTVDRVTKVVHRLPTIVIPMPLVAIIRTPRPAHRRSGHSVNEQHVDVDVGGPERGLHVHDEFLALWLVAPGHKDVEGREGRLAGGVTGYLRLASAGDLERAEDLVVERLVDARADVTRFGAGFESDFAGDAGAENAWDEGAVGEVWGKC
jgi:hypothetical protein